MTTLSTPERPLSVGLADGDRLIRDVLFLATFLLTWFTATPFPDLGVAPSLAATTSGDLLGQVLMLLLTGALAAFALAKRSWLVPRIVTLPLILTLGAFALSAMHSAYPDLAIRRLLLAAFIVFQSSMLLLLPCGREHFARLLTVAALIVLAACYLGVALIPHLAIHQASDIAEPELAGDWRGFFTHKNGAGAGMVLLIFIGIFIARAWNRLAGLSVIVPAAIFLYFTHSKSPLALLLPVLLLSYLAPRLRSSVVTFVLIVAGPIVLNVLTIGSVIVGAIEKFDAAIMSDPTFTGRNVIWKFAIDHISQRPFLGFGFESFWGMPDLVAEWNYLESWGYRASDAHNGYLNLAVTTGLVGLALALWWIVVPTFINYRRALALDVDRALTTLLLQIWIFALCLGCFESVFFEGGSALWSLTVTAIVGLRFQTLARTAG